MGSESPDRHHQKIREFLSLLPLTLELAGLPRSEHGRYFNEGQLDARATTIRAAYKTARRMLVDIARKADEKAD